MSYRLFAHPFSSYSWKAMIAFGEKGIPFDLAMIEDPDAMAELRNLWPVGQFPVLLDAEKRGDKPIIEATTIIEYLDLRHPEPARLVPADAEAALDVRFMDRVFDNHVMNMMQRIVAEYLPPNNTPNPAIVESVQGKLDIIYAWLDQRLAGQDWATPTASAWPIALPRRRSSMPTGCTASPRRCRPCAPIAHGSMRVRQSRIASRRRGPIVRYFPLGAPDRD